MRWISVCCLFAVGGVLAWTGSVVGRWAGRCCGRGCGAAVSSAGQCAAASRGDWGYQFAHDRWRLVDCASPAYLRRHLRHLDSRMGSRAPR